MIGSNAPNYWNLTSEQDDQMTPLKVEFLEETSEEDLKILNLKIKNLDSSNDPSADDQPNSEDVRTVQLIQVSFRLN